MTAHKWEELLVFQPVWKWTTAHRGEPSCLNEELCQQTDAQVTLAVKAVASCASGRGSPGVFVASSAPYSPHHLSKTV